MPGPGSNSSQELVICPKPLFECSLDEPTTGSLLRGMLVVTGWAFSQPEPVSRIEIWLDKTQLGQVNYGLPRPDVARAFKGQAPYNCGYHGLLEFNPLIIGEGEKRLRVLVVDQTGQQRELSVTVQVQAPANGPTDEAYQQWRHQHEPDEATLDSQRNAFVQLKTPSFFRLELVVRPDIDLSDLKTTLRSLQNQTYSAWELYLRHASQEQWAVFARQDERIRLSMSETEDRNAPNNRFDWLVLLEAGDQLAPQALFRLYEWEEQHPRAVAVYADEDWLDESGKPTQPFFKPDWSPEYLRQTNYIGPLLALRWDDIVLNGLGLLEADAAFEPALALGLWLAEQVNLEVGHIAEVLCHRSVPLSPARLEQQATLVKAHLARTGRAAVVEPLNEQSGWNIIALPRSYYPRLSLLLSPGQPDPDYLEKYLGEFFETVRYPNLELLIVVKNGRTKQVDLPVPVHYLRFGERTGLTNMFNQAAARSEGDYLLFLDGTVPVLSQAWLEELLHYAEQAGVGGVGGLILTEHNTVVEAGLRLDLWEGVQPLLRGYPVDSTGYGQVLGAAHEVSGLDLQGLMLKKVVFEQLGGFNPLFESRYAGPDFCLRLQQAGFRVIFTPDAAIRQVGPNWLDDTGNTLEKMLLLDIWQDWMAKPDPFYNPNFNQSYSDYRI